MKQTVIELLSLVETYTPQFQAIADDAFRAKPLPDKWSKIELVGHLIDSAHTNHRRFVTGQYEPSPPKLVYDQDFWVVANGYQKMNKDEVILLWAMVNKRIAEVLTNMPEEAYGKFCDTGKKEESLRTLKWLAEDYVRHMKHHINQVIPGSFDIIYT